jgi:hypothetical protein
MQMQMQMQMQGLGNLLWLRYPIWLENAMACDGDMVWGGVNLVAVICGMEFCRSLQIAGRYLDAYSLLYA